MKDARLTEQSVLTENTKVDAEKGILFGVRVVNRRSAQKKRRYSERALDDLARFTEGARVFDQHDPQGRALSRSTRDQFGILRNAKRVTEGVTADFHVSARERWILEDAARMPDSIMLSINALGRMASYKEGGDQVVESIRKLASVDLVPAGGTTTSLFESQDSQEEESVKWEEVTLASLRENCPDTLEEHKAEVVKIHESESDSARRSAELEVQLKESKEREAAAKKRLDELEVKEALIAKREKIETMLQEAKLPDAAITDQFRTMLESFDDEGIKGAIADRLVFVSSTGKLPRSTGAPRGTGGETHEIPKDLKAFTESLKDD